MTLGLDQKLFQDHKLLMQAMKHNLKIIFESKIMLFYVGMG